MSWSSSYRVLYLIPHSCANTMAGIKDAKCVLVIGATSDIGGALALAIQDLDSMPTVIVAGQRQERLDELAAESDRIKTARVDTGTSYDKLSQFVEDVVRKYPDVSQPQRFTRIKTTLMPLYPRRWMLSYSPQEYSTSSTSRSPRPSTSAVRPLALLASVTYAHMYLT